MSFGKFISGFLFVLLVLAVWLAVFELQGISDDLDDLSDVLTAPVAPRSDSALNEIFTDTSNGIGLSGVAPAEGTAHPSCDPCHK